MGQLAVRQVDRAPLVEQSMMACSSAGSRAWIGCPPGARSSRVPSARRACHRCTRTRSISSTAQARAVVHPLVVASSINSNNLVLAAPSTRAGMGPLNPNPIFP